MAFASVSTLNAVLINVCHAFIFHLAVKQKPLDWSQP